MQVASESEFDKQTRTCNVWPQTETEAYTKVHSNQWIHESETGWTNCKRKVISTFSRPNGDQDWDWQYELKTRSLNPNGNDINGEICSLSDKNPDVYTWKNEPSFVGCDYLK